MTTRKLPKFLDPADYRTHAKLLAMKLDEATTKRLTSMIGRHHYSWDCPEDKADGRASVQRECPPGWRAAVRESGEVLPEQALVVGMIQREGGVYLPLYVYPEPS
jgi:hypothetical protein